MDVIGGLQLRFWPVGQGLFASGAITRGGDLPDACPPLTWLYDCGTISTDQVLSNALGQFHSWCSSINAEHIEVAALSHFDKDHISGFVRLIQRVPVRRLLLPYVPLWLRVMIALAQGVRVDDDTFDAFIDPARYLRDRGFDGEILFVPSGGEPDTREIEGGEPAFDPDGDVDLELKIERAKEPPLSEEERAEDAGLLAAARVSFLPRGGRIIWARLWEFVPYNDAGLAPRADAAFLHAVRPLIEALVSRTGNLDDMLAALKQLYERTFGASSRNRNLISLFLYSGPVSARLRSRTMNCSHALRFGWAITRFAQMYTGDGTLDAGRYRAFRQFYDPAGRLYRAGFFQVMHHGARGSWHAGLAAKLKPVASIISSDPNDRRFGHPHGAVLRDFWPYSVAQVDHYTGFEFTGKLRLN